MSMSCFHFSSPPISSLEKYDVFLSFRGEDTRDNFTSHLYAALRRKSIKTYIDEESLDRGDEISPALLKAISESKISVIIFSKDYASSSWCLAELLHILECHKKNGQIVIPVFYNIDPSHVRKQQKSYATSFVKHEERFKKNLEMVQKWREALAELASLSGWDSRVTRPESKLVEDIAQDIMEKLTLISSSDGFNNKDLIGMHKHIEKVEMLLSFGSLNVRIVGIWGMGGIGKTTLAEIVFNRIHSKFESWCFLANLREESKLANGSFHLRKKLLNDLLKEPNLDIGTPCYVPNFVKERLRRKKVLVVLDDVDDSKLLGPLFGDCYEFGHESRIIVTTRDERVLRLIGVHEIYKVEELDFNESLQLFSLRAFKGNIPTKDFMELSTKVVYYAGGTPLALKVLGSYFQSFRVKSKENWEMALDKLKKFPLNDIHDKLRISYDGLDETEKAIFLDIVCFFKGMNKFSVEEVLNGCDLSATIGIDNLVDKALITITECNILWMHDLVQEMGWNIVRQESIKVLGNRSRLWIPEDAYHVLKNNEGTEATEGIFLDMSKLDEDIHLGSTVFQKMRNLRLLKIYNSQFQKKFNLYLPQDFRCLPNSLRYLSWYEYPLKSLPQKFMLQNIVQLEMRGSKLEQLWDGIQNLGNLKCIDLKFSQHLKKIPDLSQAPKLHTIDLSNCTSLVQVPSINFQNCDEKALGTLKLDLCDELKTLPEIFGNVKYLDLQCTLVQELPSSIGSLEKLIELNLQSCKFLKNLPSSIHNLKSLKSLVLSCCFSLEEIPKLPRNITYLCMMGTAIKQIPSSSIECLSLLESLSLRECKRLVSLPTNICKLKSLESFDLSGCSKLKNFPEILEPMECLKFLSLVGTRIQVLPSSLENLIGIQDLHIGGHENLRFQPMGFCINRIEELSIDDSYSGLKNFPPVVLGLHSLTQLNLNYCNILEVPNWLGDLSSLTRLSLDGNTFHQIPASIIQLSKLYEFNITHCKNLRFLPELPLSIHYLDARGCTSLETISNSRAAITFKSWRRNYLFSFFECLKLDPNECNNILTEFRFRVLRVAYIFIQRAKILGELPLVSFCYPGNEIPRWFTYQSDGSSITIKLPPNWHDVNFRGFALCVVFACDQYCSSNVREDLNFCCKVFLITNSGDSLEFYETTREKWYHMHNKVSSSEHVLMWYEYRYDKYNTNPTEYLDAKEATFNFSLYYGDEDQKDSCKIKVRSCGIRMLCLPNAEEFSITDNQRRHRRLKRSRRGAKAKLQWNLDSDTDDEQYYKIEFHNSA